MLLQIAFRDVFNTHLHTELLQGQGFRASCVMKSTTGNLLNVHLNQNIIVNILMTIDLFSPLLQLDHANSRIFQGIFDFAEEPWIFGLLCQFSIWFWSINHSCKFTNPRRRWCWVLSNAVFSLQLSWKISGHIAFHISCRVQIFDRDQDISKVVHQRLWENFQNACGALDRYCLKPSYSVYLSFILCHPIYDLPSLLISYISIFLDQVWT